MKKNDADEVQKNGAGHGLQKGVFRKVKLGEEESDSVYWRKQPIIFRLEALESIREEYNQWQYGSEPRFQRVYKIIKHA